MFKTKIYIPVANTENGNFDYDKKISTDELIRLQDEQFKRTNYNVDRFVHGYQAVGQHEVFDPITGKQILDTVDLIPLECVIQGINQNDLINEAFFDKKAQLGKMFIVRLNINPTHIDFDGESELRFWIEDSMRLLNDPTLDDRTKLKSLPKRDIIIDAGNRKYTMGGCKILEKYAIKKFPYYFAIIIEKLY